MALIKFHSSQPLLSKTLTLLSLSQVCQQLRRSLEPHPLWRGQQMGTDVFMGPGHVSTFSVMSDRLPFIITIISIFGKKKTEEEGKKTAKLLQQQSSPKFRF